MRHAPQLTRRVLGIGFCYAASQGAGLSFLIFSGLSLAPASHAVLVLGLIPLWVVFGGILFFGDRCSAGAALGLFAIIVAALIFAWSTGETDIRALSGDSLFLAASLLASAYFLFRRGSNIPSELSAALISVVSALLYLPLYLALSDGQLNNLTLADWGLQIIYQGALIGFFSFIWLNRAIAQVGSSGTATVLSLVPGLTAILAIPMLAEIPTAAQCGAIVLMTLGVLCATARSETTERSASMRLRTR